MNFIVRLPETKKGGIYICGFVLFSKITHFIACKKPDDTSHVALCLRNICCEIDGVIVLLLLGLESVTTVVTKCVDVNKKAQLSSNICESVFKVKAGLKTHKSNT